MSRFDASRGAVMGMFLIPIFALGCLVGGLMEHDIDRHEIQVIQAFDDQLKAADARLKAADDEEAKQHRLLMAADAELERVEGTLRDQLSSATYDCAQKISKLLEISQLNDGGGVDTGITSFTLKNH